MYALSSLLGDLDSKPYQTYQRMKKKAGNLPSHNDKEIQTVPGVSKIAFFAKDPQGHHLQHHLHSKEDEDEVIKYLKGPLKKIP